MKLKCTCGYCWNYGGKGTRYASCPFCRNKLVIAKAKVRARGCAITPPMKTLRKKKKYPEPIEEDFGTVLVELYEKTKDRNTSSEHRVSRVYINTLITAYKVAEGVVRIEIE